ncbi:MAG: response regulator [Elusimicrobia bacterium]|nr:response regulator [Elusimicrobiota bacterium]
MGLWDRLFKSKKTVLVVDDEEMFLETISLSLEQRGYKVYKAKDGAEGLSVAWFRKPNLVILDINMPGGKDGWEVLQALRAAPITRSMAVLMLTTVNQVNDVNKLYKLGANGYLAKPTDSVRLYQKVEELIGKP